MGRRRMITPGLARDTAAWDPPCQEVKRLSGTQTRPADADAIG